MINFSLQTKCLLKIMIACHRPHVSLCVILFVIYWKRRERWRKGKRKLRREKIMKNYDTNLKNMRIALKDHSLIYYKNHWLDDFVSSENFFLFLLRLKGIGEWEGGMVSLSYFCPIFLKIHYFLAFVNFENFEVENSLKSALIPQP